MSFSWLSSVMGVVDAFVFAVVVVGVAMAM
jgi:hypothetical protein